VAFEPQKKYWCHFRDPELIPELAGSFSPFHPSFGFKLLSLVDRVSEQRTTVINAVQCTLQKDNIKSQVIWQPWKMGFPLAARACLTESRDVAAD
jgi:hypothetical protein